MRTSRTAMAVAAILVAAAGLAGCGGPTTSTLARPYDPVVLQGADVAALVGAAPNDVVGFRFSGSSWSQIPVQIDERAPVTISTAYHQGANSATNVTINTYTDANTWTGADPNPAFDADDELAFMAPDAGGRPAAFTEPSGVVPGSGVDVRITDPLDAGGTQVGHVFLFRRAAGSGLQPGAGQSYVDYQFSLASGDYKSTYHFTAGPNPEDTTVTTPFYRSHFADRWLNDELHITTGGASGVDIIDRNKTLFAPGVCARSEDTFDNGEGAFLVNKSGPVRAIRGYVGANSGPNTQREHVFYRQRQDITTNLRVHAIPSIMDLYDYSPAVAGSTYSNNLNPNGVTVDGVPDTVTNGGLQWEKLDGPGGALVQSGSFTATQSLSPGSYYEDNKTSPTTQCTGDAFAYGTSGSYVNQSINCTEPATGCADTLVARRILTVLPPGIASSAAQLVDNWDRHPLNHTTSAWSG